MLSSLHYRKAKRAIIITSILNNDEMFGIQVIASGMRNDGTWQFSGHLIDFVFRSTAKSSP
jgi:hypothetical protein